MKVTPRAVKIYKPEVLNCPKCQSRLKYNYTISNKVVQFTSGRIFRIKNMGYSCPCCNDGNLYISSTANKLAFKGYTYSAKTVCIIDYEKSVNHKGREAICDFLANKNIEISDRNIDIIHKRFTEILNQDFDSIIKDAYNNMLAKYNEIRISLDLITVNEIAYIILYDFFKGDIIGLWKFNGVEDPNLKDILAKYINDEYNITTIFTVRGYVSKLVPIVKSIMPKTAKVYSFLKF